MGNNPLWLSPPLSLGSTKLRLATSSQSLHIITTLIAIKGIQWCQYKLIWKHLLLSASWLNMSVKWSDFFKEMFPLLYSLVSFWCSCLNTLGCGSWRRLGSTLYRYVWTVWHMLLAECLFKWKYPPNSLGERVLLFLQGFFEWHHCNHMRQKRGLSVVKLALVDDFLCRWILFKSG
jgi:hypothetical protein